MANATCCPEQEGGHVSYPGEGMVATRRLNTKEGVPVDKAQWAELQGM
eukprot:COSAG05_NODE_2283_length_3287_cov_5.276035_1_plen_48_part_00